MENFSELNLKPALAQALKELQFEKPTPIQAQTLPILMGNSTDFVGRAATGTGKTAAFGIPLLSNLDLEDKRIQAIVLCPTRELAIQTAEKLSLMGKFMPVSVPAIYGGAGYRDQVMALKRSYVAVATPGRLLDHMNRGNISVEGLKVLVLDEADEMISMGFKDDLEAILKHIPKDTCHTWLFSATMPPHLDRVTRTYLTNPKSVHTNRDVMLSGTVRQVGYAVRDKNKTQGLCKLLEMTDDFYGLIFCQTKALVMDLTEHLRVRGFKVDCLHGDKDQRERERTLKLFKERRANILVCTDVASRGLDVEDLTHVINYSLPMDKESYVHRIGRTGRSGREGTAISLVAPTQMHLVRRLEQLTKTRFEVGIFPSGRDISLKKVNAFLPRLMASPGKDRAIAVLDENWKTTLEGMSKEEIAGRFLSIVFPDLFDAAEKPDDLGLIERERPPSRGRFEPRNREDRPGGGFSRRFDREDSREGRRPFGRPDRGSFGSRPAGGARPFKRPFGKTRIERDMTEDSGGEKRFGKGPRPKGPFQRVRPGKHKAASTAAAPVLGVQPPPTAAT